MCIFRQKKVCVNHLAQLRKRCAWTWSLLALCRWCVLTVRHRNLFSTPPSGLVPKGLHKSSIYHKNPHMSKDGRQIYNMTIAADSRRDLCTWRCLGCCHGKLVRASPATSQRTRKRSDGRVGSLISCQGINQIQSVIKHQAHHSSFITHDA